MSEPARHDVKDILDHALELGGVERAALLDAECADDDELRAEVEGLIRALESKDGFLETPALEMDVGEIASWGEPEAIFVGRQVGRYTLDRVIASGGMGTVYEAHVEGSGEACAVKLMKPGLVSESALRRFEFEASALSRLDHVGIARVFDVGSYDTGLGNVPFFAMEYIADGTPVTEYVAAKKLDARERLGLFGKICSAVEHGHQKGIIHRDLKPSNILVDADGQPKVIDFGVARATDADLATVSQHTGEGQLVGTLQYMSPEQCGGDPSDIDTRSDVYSLGVVLFELLTGSLPYDLRGVPLTDAMQIVREHPPTRPSSHDQSLSGDLETIVLKALEKERDRRYGSVAELGGDVERYLNNEPIRARPPSTLYQLKKFAKRNRLAVGASLVAIGLLIAGTVVSAALAVGQSRAARESRIEAAKAEQISWFLQDMLGGLDPDFAKGADTELLRRILDETGQRIGTDLAGQPEVEASIRSTLGDTYRIIGEYEQAETHLTIALELRRAELGDMHDDTLTSVNSLGELCYEAGQFDRAEGLLLEALAGRRQALGEDNLDTADSRSLLGSLYRELGRLDEAEPIYLQTLDYRRRVLGDEHNDTIAAMNNVAALYFSKGNYEEARRRFEDLLQVSLRVFGEEDEATVMARFNLAAQLVELGRFDEAEPLHREVVDIRRRILGPSHPNTLVSMALLGDVYRELDRYDDAAPLLEETVEIAKESMPQGHWLIGYFLSRRGYLLRDLEEYELAETVFLEAYEILADAFGRDHARASSVARSIAALYDAWGKPEQAEPWRARMAAAGG